MNVSCFLCRNRNRNRWCFISPNLHISATSSCCLLLLVSLSSFHSPRSSLSSRHAIRPHSRAPSLLSTILSLYVTPLHTHPTHLYIRPNHIFPDFRLVRTSMRITCPSLSFLQILFASITSLEKVFDYLFGISSANISFTGFVAPDPTPLIALLILLFSEFLLFPHIRDPSSSLRVLLKFSHLVSLLNTFVLRFAHILCERSAFCKSAELA